MKEFFNKQHKKLMIIPAILLLLAVFQIANQISTTGTFLNKGVSLTGGTSITIDKPYNVAEMQYFLNKQFPNEDIIVRSRTSFGKQNGLLIETDAQTQSKITTLIDAIKTKMPDITYKTENTGSSLGNSFFKEIIWALIWAFIFMGLVVFFSFKSFIPSFAIIFSAISDIVVTLAIVNVMGMKISSAGIAGFLLLIGYSVDTDILLTTRVLKRHNGTIFSRVIEAMKTGLTMSFTTMAALIVVLVFSTSENLIQIMTIVLIGLLVDIINTWLMNASIIRTYAGRKK